MTDKELLELAAKAAGVFMRKEDWPYSNPFDPECLKTTFDQDECSITGTRVWYGSDGEVGGTEPHTWSPLTNDGAALRLVVKCKLHMGMESKTVSAWAVDNFGNFQTEILAHRGDEAATRRAIVRAAAEIGRAMP